jgi:hypothetical protein
MSESPDDPVIGRIAFQGAQCLLQFAAAFVLVLVDEVQYFGCPGILILTEKARINLGAAPLGKQQIGRQHQGGFLR